MVIHRRLPSPASNPPRVAERTKSYFCEGYHDWQSTDPDLKVHNANGYFVSESLAAPANENFDLLLPDAIQATIYTPAQLESLHLWEHLAVKAVALGFCAP